MQFIVTKILPPSPKDEICYLLTDNWDDYSFKTSFVLYYGNNKESKKIGPVKIMREGQEEGARTELPKSYFQELDNSYCSLGQEQSYYEELMTLPSSVRKAILKGLRDCVENTKIYEVFKNEKVMQTSLLRGIYAEKITTTFKSILKGHAELTPFYFKFLINSDDEKSIGIRVTPYSKPPTNVHVIIGRNGVGKTRILSGIADKLTKTDENDFSLPGKIVFPEDKKADWVFSSKENHANFSNLITIAFSAFDKFTPIAKEMVQGDIRYDYIGLRTQYSKHEFKSSADLENEFRTSLEICLDTQRKKRWIRAIKLLNSDPVFAEYKLEELPGWPKSTDEIGNIFSKLSSGHKIILLCITRLVELVEERTLVLIDEPETHLHPPLLASFTRVLSDLLITRNGVALIATHSPVVLQEVPKSCVTVINRVNTEYGFYRPEIETFGENVGTLTRTVFQLEVTESGYHKLLKDYLKSHTYKELLEEYKGQIGAEGRAIARAIAATQED